MHASILPVALLLAAPFTSALPALNSRATASTVDIVLRTGDGDASIGFSVPLNRLTQSTAQNSRGVKATISTTSSSLFCRAFSDARGNTPLGGVFTSDISASFTDASDGEVDSTSDLAVKIGAYCCVDKEDGFAAAGCAGKTATPPPAAPPKDNPPPKTGGKAKTVRVMFTGLSELAAQAEIPADGSVVPLAKAAPLFEDVISATIVDAEDVKGAACQVFSDKEGRKPVARFGLTEVVLNKGRTTKVESLRCVGK